MTAQSNEATPGRLVFRSSRRKWLKVLLIGAGFVATGVLVSIARSAVIGWVTVVFFGIVMVVAAAQLIAPGQLVVTPSAIEVSSVGRRYSRDLVSCSKFTVWRNPVARQDLVVFNHPLDRSKRAAGMNRQLSGHSSGLPDTYAMDAVELARVLNEARSAALAAAAKA